MGAYFVEQAQEMFLMALVVGMNPLDMGSYSDLSSHLLSKHKMLLLF
jgi:hypothetical protein